MDNLVRQKLSEIINTYGKSLIDDPRRLEGLLLDLCGENKREINALIGALKLKVPADLLNTSNVPLEILSARLIKQIEDDLGLKEELARWTVESWAVVLGIELVISIPPLELVQVLPIKDEEIKQPVPPPVQPPPKLTPDNKQRNKMFFLKSTLAIAGVCVIALLIILSQPRRKESATPKETVALDIPMVRVPSADKFPTGTDDSGSCTTVNYPYYLAKTEVTYQQWKTVRDWAVEHGYTVAHGSQGGYHDGDTYKTYKTGHTDHPVTGVSWRNVMVWCNALTEYCNSVEGTDYSCVYRYNGAIVRDAKDAIACDNVEADSGSNGFRLPTSMEWELAARYIDGNRWTPGNYASGADGDINDGDATGAVVAWSNATHPGGTKAPNVLGIYDMSGNVEEWCFDWQPDHIGSMRVRRGGGQGDWSYSMAVGNNSNGGLPSDGNYRLGFRLARSLKP